MLFTSTKRPKDGGTPPLKRVIDIFPDVNLAEIIVTTLDEHSVTLEDGIYSHIEIDDLKVLSYLYLPKPNGVISSAKYDEREQEFLEKASENHTLLNSGRAPNSRIINFEGLQHLTELLTFVSSYHDFYDFKYLKNKNLEMLRVGDNGENTRIIKNMSDVDTTSTNTINFDFYGYESEHDLIGNKANVAVKKDDVLNLVNVPFLQVVNINMDNFNHFNYVNPPSNSHVIRFSYCAIVDFTDLPANQFDAYNMRVTSFMHWDVTKNTAFFVPITPWAGGVLKFDSRKIGSDIFEWDEETQEITFLEAATPEIYWMAFEINGYNFKVDVAFNVMEAI